MEIKQIEGESASFIEVDGIIVDDGVPRDGTRLWVAGSFENYPGGGYQSRRVIFLQTASGIFELGREDSEPSYDESHPCHTTWMRKIFEVPPDAKPIREVLLPKNGEQKIKETFSAYGAGKAEKIKNIEKSQCMDLFKRDDCFAEAVINLARSYA